MQCCGPSNGACFTSRARAQPVQQVHINQACSGRQTAAHAASPSTTEAAPKSQGDTPKVSKEVLDTVFADDSSEQVGPTPLEVEGAIPTWLQGDYYRTGPGLYKGFDHWFDGLAMLVNFRFSGGEVAWQQRFLDTEAYRAYRRTGEPQFQEFVYSPGVWKAASKAILDMLGLIIGVTDNAGVAFFPSTTNPKEGVAVTESANGFYAIGRSNLSTNRSLTPLFKHRGLKGSLQTAHAKPLRDGRHLNVLLNVPYGGLQVVKYEMGQSEAPPEVVYELPVSNPEKLNSWMHDLAVSENYVALVEQPLFFDVKALMGGGGDYAAFKWAPEHNFVVRVLGLDGSGILRTYTLPPMFNFHYVNTFEKVHPELGPCMCLDAAFGRDPEPINQFMLHTVKDPYSQVDPMYLRRIWLPLEEGKEAVVEELVEEHEAYGCFAEMVTINPRCKFQDYRFAWGNSVERPSGLNNKVTKWDMEEKTVVAQWGPEGGAPLCEPQMVPRPEAEGEDDGVVVVPAVQGDGRTFVAVLNAQDLSELARAYTPTTVPIGFHSLFLPLAE